MCDAGRVNQHFSARVHHVVLVSCYCSLTLELVSGCALVRFIYAAAVFGPHEVAAR